METRLIIIRLGLYELSLTDIHGRLNPAGIMNASSTLLHNLRLLHYPFIRDLPIANPILCAKVSVAIQSRILSGCPPTWHMSTNEASNISSIQSNDSTVPDEAPKEHGLEQEGSIAATDNEREDSPAQVNHVEPSIPSAADAEVHEQAKEAVEDLTQKIQAVDDKAADTDSQDPKEQSHDNNTADSGVYSGIELLGAQPADIPVRDAPTPKPTTQPPPVAETAVLESHEKTAEIPPEEELQSKQESGEPSKEDVGGAVSDDDSRSEIQSIMEQFEGQEESEQAVGDESIEDGEHPTHHPPRHSSLHSQRPEIQSSPVSATQPAQAVGSPVRPPSMRNVSFSPSLRSGSGVKVSQSPLQSPALNKALPPAPDPEPDLPFDFHRFLEQLRHRTADSVAKYLRSFLQEFGKKQWMVHEQVKIISDFLVFIANKMAQCEIWRGVSDAEFDNAREGMEKLVMNRLYSQTFSPAIPPPAPISPQKGKSRQPPRQPGPGRRGQHQEDVERDEVLAQKVRIYGWVREEHLDIAPVGKTGQRFLTLAQQELLKIRSYRAPRDKVICVLNCCKVIFGLLRNSKEADTSADAFVPLLIYVILRANPEHLVSNVQYISRFRNPEKLGGEAGYYLSSLMGAVQFIENLDRTALTVSNEDFEKNVEAAVSAIAERKSMDMSTAELSPSAQHLAPRDAEKVEHSPRSSSENRARSKWEGASTSATGTASGDQTPVSGLLKTIQKPLSSIGRIFSEEAGSGGNERPPHRTSSSVDGAQRLSPAMFQPPRRSSEMESPSRGTHDAPSPNLPAADAAARQASVETAEAQRIQRAEHQDVVATLVTMFPNLDRDVISDVVRMKEGRVGSAVDACLALNG